MPQRIQPALETAGQMLVSRTLAELDSRLAPHMERIPELLHQLSAHEVQAEESLRMHRERLRQAAENSRRDAVAQLEQAFSSVRNEFEAARGEALVKWNEELNASGARAAHAAIEDLANQGKIYFLGAGYALSDLSSSVWYAGVNSPKPLSRQRLVSSLPCAVSVHLISPSRTFAAVLSSSASLR